MKAYIFGENYKGQPDWYYTEHDIQRPHRVKAGGKSLLVFAAPSTKPGGIGYIFGVRAIAKAIEKHNLLFSKQAAEAEANRRWDKIYGGGK